MCLYVRAFLCEICLIVHIFLFYEKACTVKMLRSICVGPLASNSRTLKAQYIYVFTLTSGVKTHSVKKE